MGKKLFILIRLGFILLGSIAIGCGGAAGKTGAKSAEEAKTSAAGERVHSKKARDDFAKAAKKYQETLAAGLNKSNCKSVADEFQDVADDYDNMPEALYNVGAVYRKCNMKTEAKSAFKKTLKVYPKHQLSLSHLAVMALEDGDENKAQDFLRKAVSAGKNKLDAVPAYVNAATISRKKGRASGDKDKLAKAQLNLRRALAIDNKYMPALYQLAMLYLDTAAVEKNVSFLTLAQLVCTQAINLNPEYGPIYHALGQIQLQKNELIEALKSFQAAFQKDPDLFASYMNYAAINLGFRGYQEAKTAFEKAIAIDPKSYDAHIGLGVALRGLGDYTGAKAEYKKAMEIDKRRTDYIFNLGVLEMDYLNPGTVEGFDKAKSVFQKFVKNATPEHKVDPDKKGPQRSWFQKAEDRIALCDKNKKQLIEAEKAMAEMEKLAKEQAAREAEMKRQMEKAKELEKQEESGAVAPDGTEAPEGAEEAPAPAPAPAAEEKPAEEAAPAAE